MPRRWSFNTRLWAYRYLCLRDGEECANCHRKPTAQNKLEIDHLDGNSWNNDPPNLRLLCKGCNVHFENLAAEERAALTRERSDRNERERGKAATQFLRAAVNYKDGSPEMQANYLCEIDFREWTLSKVVEQGSYPKKQAIFAGAELVGCSPTTTSRYLEKLLSDHGPLTTQKDLLGDLQLVFKDQGISTQSEPSQESPTQSKELWCDLGEELANAQLLAELDALPRELRADHLRNRRGEYNAKGR